MATVKKRIKQQLKTFVKHLVAFVLRHPILKKVGNIVISNLPTLRTRLKKLFFPTDADAPQKLFSHISTKSLPPRAAEIYKLLLTKQKEV